MLMYAGDADLYVALTWEHQSICVVRYYVEKNRELHSTPTKVDRWNSVLLTIIKQCVC